MWSSRRTMLYKIDGRSDDMGRGSCGGWIPEGEKVPDANRGAALWGNFVITAASFPPRIIATDKDTGKVAWGEPTFRTARTGCCSPRRRCRSRTRSFSAPPAATAACAISSAWRSTPRPLGSRSCGHVDSGTRARPGSETWKDNHNAWQTGGGAMWVTGSYDVDSDQVLWGTGNPMPWSDPFYRPGDNLFTASLISWNPDSGKVELVSPVSARRHVGLRRGGQPYPDQHRHCGPASQDCHPCGAQRVPLHVRARQWADRDGQALCGQRQLDQGHRSEDRQARRL